MKVWNWMFVDTPQASYQLVIPHLWWDLKDAEEDAKNKSQEYITIPHCYVQTGEELKDDNGNIIGFTWLVSTIDNLTAFAKIEFLYLDIGENNGN